MELAPIVLFVYNRPEHLKRTVEALQRNELAAESELVIYSDGPGTDTDAAKVNAVRAYIRTITGFKNVTINASTANKGLAGSVIDGVTAVVNQYGKIIVLEDDVLTSRYFIKFMNDALNAYEDCADVLAVGSWNSFAPPRKVKANFFLRLPDSIAWATYQRSWALFEKDGQLLLDRLLERNLIDKFNMENSYRYDQMLQDQIAGRVSSWAIRWTATAILNNKLTYYPQYSMTKHIGFDAAATHCKSSYDLNKRLRLAEKALDVNKEKAVESEVAVALWQRFNRKLENECRRRARFSYYLIYLPRLLASKIVPDAVKMPLKQWLRK